MSEDQSPILGQELLDDFFAECDEHFRTLRDRLASLERDPGAAEALDALYRGVHSLKGNAGIVGLRPLEELAHAAEDVLRRLIRSHAPVETDTAARLGEAAHRMERIVAAYRLKEALPDISDLLDRLSRETAAPAAALWQARFAPNAERDARGINVNSVRARLAALGEIVSAEPTIVAGGGILFTFTVRLRGAPADAAAWSADGVEWTEAPGRPAGASEPASASAGGATAAPSHLVRVDLSRLDELMRLVGEMVIQRSRLGDRIGRMGEAGRDLQEAMAGLGRLLRDMRGAISRMRLVPIGEIFSRLPYVVRDLERDGGKRVRLALEGEHTEIDKYLVERLREPLLHLVRNAVSHGIESARERREVGKAEEATLTLRASSRGDFVLIEVIDDGRGVDAEAVGRRAAAAGIPCPPHPDAVQLLQVLCTPGFSTREQADRASGRGVGLDVVASVVRDLGGTLALETTPGRGTTFALRLPLTLSIAETFIVSAGRHVCAVPQGFVEEIVQVPAASIRRVQGVSVAPYRTGLLPLVSLHEMFGAPASTQTASPVVVIGSDRGLTGLVVDRVHGHREVVIRPLHDPLIRVPGISGATELGDGKPILILDPPALASGPVRPREAALSA
ncbi:MAG TPA: chemotaxis protein CheA [Opitutaceae bacterium]|nr:chemotaxis protein CheA [Opitutaceae bacterium]